MGIVSAFGAKRAMAPCTISSADKTEVAAVNDDRKIEALFMMMGISSVFGN